MSNPDDAKVAELRTGIEQTRTELGETVELLAQKVDVKARAKEKVDDATARVRQSAQNVTTSGRELVHEVRTDPAVPARRMVERLRASVQQHPKEWATAVAALLAFAALVTRVRLRRARG
jgi:hypothetical protein